MRSGKGPVGVAGAYAGDWIFCERLVGGEVLVGNRLEWKRDWDVLLCGVVWLDFVWRVWRD